MRLDIPTVSTEPARDRLRHISQSVAPDLAGICVILLWRQQRPDGVFHDVAGAPISCRACEDTPPAAAPPRTRAVAAGRYASDRISPARSASSPPYSATLTCGARTFAAAPVDAEDCAAKCAALMGEFVQWLPAEQVVLVQESPAALRSSLHFFCKVRTLAGARGSGGPRLRR
jgi:hypothetical protein